MTSAMFHDKDFKVRVQVFGVLRRYGRHTPTSQLKQEKLWPLVSISNLLSICWLSARNKALSKVGYEMFAGLALSKGCLCTVGEEWTLTSHEAGSKHQEPSHPWSLVNLSSPFGFAQLRAPQQEEELLCSLKCTFSEPCIFPSYPGLTQKPAVLFRGWKGLLQPVFPPKGRVGFIYRDGRQLFQEAWLSTSHAGARVRVPGLE